MSDMTRRELLTAGAGSFAAAYLPLTVPAPNTPEHAKARSVILVWLDGGPSQFDTFDPKPIAPSGIRSEFGAIKTDVPGLYICELMPRMARQMRRCTLIRTVSHDEWTHERACHLLLTGKRTDPSVVYPSIGSVIARDLRRSRSIPTYVTVPGDTFGFGYARSGSLNSEFNPYAVPESVGHVPQSHALIEPTAIQARYGGHPFGQRCLTARRLVESGARFVIVSHGGWDAHCDGAAAARDWLVPPLDQGLAALIEDLHTRGMLEETMVVCMGEFGRSPKINPLGGRDHWPRSGFALFAGAGVPGGQVVGRTDSQGAEPVDGRVSPQDMAATIYAKLGIGNPKSYPMLDGGEIIQELG